MTRKIQLNLSHTLKELTTSLEETVKEICPSPSDPFEKEIMRFAQKYTVPIASSLDELLEASLTSSPYLPKTETKPLSQLTDQIT